VMVRFSPDGRYLAVKHQERSNVILSVWDTRQAVLLLTIPDGVTGDAVDFHPDGHTLAAGRRDGSIVFYDLDERRELRRLPLGPVPHTIRFDSTGKRIATISLSANGRTLVRDVKDGTILASWATPEIVRAVTWHPDDRTLAVGAEFGAIRLFDTTD